MQFGKWTSYGIMALVISVIWWAGVREQPQFRNSIFPQQQALSVSKDTRMRLGQVDDRPLSIPEYYKTRPRNTAALDPLEIVNESFEVAKSNSADEKFTKIFDETSEIKQQLSAWRDYQEQKEKSSESLKRTILLISMFLLGLKFSIVIRKNGFNDENVVEVLLTTILTLLALA